MNETADIFVIGGGVNGVGIARDAAGRGLKTILVDQADLAGATSSASSKLIHGGLRYLENYEFRLVRESLMERETLWKIAPHLITPMRFILPHQKGMRPAFILRLGLFLYDHIGGRKLLPATKRLALGNVPEGTPLQDGLKVGFEYSDCWVDDARLVIANALGAQEKGVQILTRHTFTGAERRDGMWRISVKNSEGRIHTCAAKVLVNASGPWVDQSLQKCGQFGSNQSTVRLVKGSHIIVPKLYGHDRAYTFQHPDGRVIFAIPYEKNFTLIGTTDTPFSNDPREAKADEAEIEYLCALASQYFAQPVQPEDVVWSYSGVRPLYDDGAESASKATRDYVLDLQDQDGACPLLNIYGGKVTTYRCLAEEALEKLEPYIEMKTGAWTKDAPLPGGDLPTAKDPKASLDAFIQTVSREYQWLDAAVAERLAASYGTRVHQLLDGVKSSADMGQYFGAGLFAREIDFLVQYEWAVTAEDVLWRRSKLGLHMTADQRAAVSDYLL